MSKDKTILVTGGAGFVGSNLIKLFLNKTNHKIVSIDNYTSGNSAYHTLESGDKFQSNVGGSGEHTWISAGASKMTLTNAGVLGIGTAIPVGKSLESYNTGLSTPSLTWGVGNPGQRFVNEGSELKFGFIRYPEMNSFISNCRFLFIGALGVP